MGIQRGNGDEKDDFPMRPLTSEERVSLTLGGLLNIITSVEKKLKNIQIRMGLLEKKINEKTANDR